tara:strand:- start:793 stop:999 length:207 start_codon:yes stop_codon:yes gene_type:complete
MARGKGEFHAFFEGQKFTAAQIIVTLLNVQIAVAHSGSSNLDQNLGANGGRDCMSALRERCFEVDHLE